MFNTVQARLLTLRTNPMAWSAIILLSMCFCFFIAKNTGDLGQWTLALLGIIIMCLSFKRTPHDWKIQAAVSFALAIPAEYFLSIYLHWYTYAWGAVPPWVYIGHSIVHLGSLVLAAYLIKNKSSSKWFIRSALLLTLIYGIYSFTTSNDVVGLACTAFILLVIGIRSSYQVFLASFSMFVVWLEWWGVFFGQWHWAPTVLGAVNEANPPANIVAGYCVLAWITIFVSEKLLILSKKRFFVFPVTDLAE